MYYGNFRYDNLDGGYSWNRKLDRQTINRE